MIKILLLACLCVLTGNSRAYAQEYVRQILECKGAGVWDGESHDVFVDVFEPEPGQEYRVKFAHGDGTDSTYADSLTMYCHFDAVFKTGNSSQIYSPHLWLAVPLSRRSSPELRYKLNSSWGLREKQAKVAVSINTRDLKGKLSYKYWVGYTSWGAPDLQFKTDLSCVKHYKRIDSLQPAVPEARISLTYAGGTREAIGGSAADMEKKKSSYVLVPKAVRQSQTMKIAWKYLPRDKDVWLGKLHLYKGARFLAGIIPENQKYLPEFETAWGTGFNSVTGGDFKIKAVFYRGNLNAPDPVAEVWSDAFAINKYEQSDLPKGEQRCVDSDNSPDYLKKVVVFPVAAATNPELFSKGVASGAVYAGSSDPSRHVILGQSPDPAMAKETDGAVSIVYDHCQGDDLVEGYCTPEGLLSAMGVKCPNGCSQGACKK
ncbi:MAG TPA: hypothetical protein PKI19_06595 [Elusimicrobiales bacterium]|nr:hypothetical protein [Elusimicrobiales bacterium]